MPYGFRILGPVELTRESQPVAVGPPKRRAMLAALLLDANRPVPLATLTAAMWPGLPPASAVPNLRNHASFLRRVLCGRLVARPQAYELGVAPAELDAAEFERLARVGRQALADGEPSTAAVRFGEALSLWRGRAGQGLPRGTSLEAQLTALEEQRLDLFEDYAQARLHTRAYPEIAADLRRHLAAWPLRERAWALLMLTLYRAGNASSALSAYSQARSALRDHLGIEPGPELRRLHRRLLERDASLNDPRPPSVDDPHTVPASRRPATGTPATGTPATGAGAGAEPAGAAPTIPRPRHPPELASRWLPPELVVPVGRDRELAAITGALRAGGGVVVVSGRTGAGKSALGIRAAHLVAEEFPDGCLALDLGGTGPAPRPPAGVTEAVLGALGVDDDQLPPGEDERAAAYQAVTTGRRILILLDDAASAGQVRPLLAGTGGATLLVTARRRPAGLNEVRHIEIGPLSEADALRVLAAHAGEHRAAAEPHALRRLVHLCDGLPLALQIVGERLARHPELPPGLLADHLANQPLDGLRIDDMSVRGAVAADYRAVTAEDPVAAHAFRLLGELEPGATITPEALADRFNEDASRVFHALEHLVDARLVDSPQPGHYRTTGLPYMYAAELATTAREETDSRNEPA